MDAWHARYARWAYEERRRIIERLGGRCKECGATERLEIDHIDGRDWQPRKAARWTRVRIYLEEEKRGLLQVLCRSCNAKKSNVEKGKLRDLAAALASLPPVPEVPAWVTEGADDVAAGLEPF